MPDSAREWTIPLHHYVSLYVLGYSPGPALCVCSFQFMVGWPRQAQMLTTPEFIWKRLMMELFVLLVGLVLGAAAGRSGRRCRTPGAATFAIPTNTLEGREQTGLDEPPRGLGGR